MSCRRTATPKHKDIIAQRPQVLIKWNPNSVEHNANKHECQRKRRPLKQKIPRLNREIGRFCRMVFHEAQHVTEMGTHPSCPYARKRCNNAFGLKWCWAPTRLQYTRSKSELKLCTSTPWIFHAFVIYGTCTLIVQHHKKPWVLLVTDVLEKVAVLSACVLRV